VSTPDGDFIDMDWSAPGLIADPIHTTSLLAPVAITEPLPSGSAAMRWLNEADNLRLTGSSRGPALVLFHGLEGSSKSRYAQAIAQYFRARGWIVVIAHFRGCSGVANNMARAYHSGDTSDVAFILDTLRAKIPQAVWHAAGVSLGGNALLKYLGETGASNISHGLNAACAVSVPLDLVAAGNHLSDSFFNKNVYTRYFLHTLKPKVLEKAQRFPGVIDVMGVSQARTLRDFDNAYTAPMHGFQDAQDYWQKSSSKPWLTQVKTPTLLINARNDPFLPEAALPAPSEASSKVLLHFPAEGGHAGFVTGRFPGRLTWLPERMARFFATNC